jgi:hypothetical protein
MDHGGSPAGKEASNPDRLSPNSSSSQPSGEEGQAGEIPVDCRLINGRDQAKSADCVADKA